MGISEFLTTIDGCTLMEVIGLGIAVGSVLFYVFLIILTMSLGMRD